MKLTCDLCGEYLENKTDGAGAVCSGCGIEYSMDRLREKMDEKMRTAAETIPLTRSKKAEDDSQIKRNTKNSGTKKKMPVILPLIALIVFLDGLLVDNGVICAAVFLVCLVIAVITILIWKPWK